MGSPVDPNSVYYVSAEEALLQDMNNANLSYANQISQADQAYTDQAIADRKDAEKADDEKADQAEQDLKHDVVADTQKKLARMKRHRGGLKVDPNINLTDSSDQIKSA